MNKMTFEEIKEHCKEYEENCWEIDVWTHGDDTAIRFYDTSRPLELSVSTVVVNSCCDSDTVQRQICKLRQSFADLWHDYYQMLERKHFPELHE